MVSKYEHFQKLQGSRNTLYYKPSAELVSEREEGARGVDTLSI